MTKVLVGVAAATATVPEAAQWVAQLLGEETPTEWLHVVPLAVGGIWSLEPMITAEIAERMAEQLASRAEGVLRRLAPEQTQVRVRVGSPAPELLNRADTLQAPLVAVEATAKGVLSSVLLGSVARALVEGAHQSVLLTRGSAPQHPLRVVVATDHSAYATKALDALVALQPTGIGRLTVVSALPLSGTAGEHLQERTHNVAVRLGTALGLSREQVASEVRQGEPFPVIEAVLADTDADLLILGAKGHGLWERLTLGSVSHRAAHYGSRSTLIVRAQ